MLHEDSMRALALILLTGLAATARADEAAPALPPVRAAVERALPFLEKEGVKWHTDNNCLSCHHIPFMTWTHLEAGKRGFPVDQTRLKEWIGWCVQWAEPKGGDDVLAELLLMLPREAITDATAQKKFESLPATILSKQKFDAHWDASGQFRGEQWPSREADEVTTMLMLLGLSTPWADTAKTAAVREKANVWLNEGADPQATRTLTMRLLFDHYLGDHSKKEELTRTLLSQQKPDGGWSWKMSNSGSDPLATGEALYVLSVIGAPTWTAADRQRTVDCLLKTQLEDGSWHQDHKRISSKIRKDAKPRVDTIYSYFATGWATMGLLQLLPERVVANAGK
jgi:hypothetical protein